MGHEQAAALRVLAGIGRLGERRVRRVPCIEEGVAALFDPAVEVGCGDGVGRGEQRIRGVEQLDRRLLIDHALGVRPIESGNGAGKLAALVLDDQRSAAADELVEARLGCSASSGRVE